MENNENIEEKIMRETAGKGFSFFIEKHRRPLLACIVFIFGACLAFVAVMITLDELNKKAIAGLELLMERYEKVLKSEEYISLKKTEADAINTEEVAGQEDAGGNETAAADNSEKAEDIAGFVKDMQAFAESNSGYPSAEAWSVIAHLAARQKNWAEAETAYLNAANKGKKTHLAPVSFFNAGVCAEEQGKNTDAITHYTESVKYTEFAQAAHAQFSIGRLYEETSDKTAAAEAYQAVIDKWPKAESWVDLAHRQIIAMNIEK
ncbi:MAG: soluble NSF attachment family protein [Spirochaetaceae bacterium]|jgi:tetratricopeptide (TPR) repeat protein|nr:soluble NSF attachment family protein [Spirochaetaceae bacterium]